MNKDEKAYQRIAAAYLKEYSAELRHELEDADLVRAMPTPALDRRVHDRIALIKRGRRRNLFSGLAAACLIVAVLTPAMWQRYSQSQLPPPAAEQPAAPSYETLPLSFTLPEQFSVASVEQDLEKTVYSFDDRMRDPVVMTMERKGDTAFFDTLTPITVAGREVYGRSDGGYSLLAFEKEDILYVLTCAHDINTLTALSRGILV